MRKTGCVWASSGYPGNSHDAIIFKSTDLKHKISNKNYLPSCIVASEMEIYSLLLGDSAFLFLPWLMKPYGNAIQTKEQGYFNYRLSTTLMVVEGAFGQLKGHWRILLWKNECHSEELKLVSLACIILHNICIDLEDKGMRAWDITFDE